MGYDRSDCWMTCGERDDKCAALKINDPFAEIERLQAALAWYADKDNYDTGQDTPDILIDGGATARRALEQT